MIWIIGLMLSHSTILTGDIHVNPKMKFFIVICLVLVGVTAREKSVCEKHRDREIAKPSIGNVVPECEENGDYKGKQCRKDSNLCQCWDKNGRPLTISFSQLKACDCVRLREDALEKEESHMLGVYIPQCNSDGTYARKQCWSSTGTCWCVDENGKKTSEPTRNEVNC